MVRCPWWTRARIARIMRNAPSQVEPAVGKVEALVAQGEVGDLLVAERHGEPLPVVEGGVGHLVPGEAAPVVGDGHVADLSAPPLGERHGDPPRLGDGGGTGEGAAGKLADLLLDEVERL